MSSFRVTLKDIAKRLNVSPSTVSRALKDNPEIGASTRHAVRQLAEELNYQPNAVALSLRKKKTFTIGVVVPEIVHYFFSSVISGVEDVAYQRNYQVILCQSNEKFDHEVMNIRTLANSQVDGILISCSKETTDFSHIVSIKDKDVPVVFYDRYNNTVNLDSVIVDDFDGAYQATDHLISVGCKRIAHFKGPLHMEIHSERLNGYLKAMKDHGLLIDENLIVEADNYKAGNRAVIEFIDKGIVFDGIFAVNDLTAVGAMKAIKSRGLQIPRDVAIVGFGDDSTLSEMVDPTLTSIKQSGFEMGKEATMLLLNKINGNKDKPQLIKIKTELNIRESTKR